MKKLILLLLLIIFSCSHENVEVENKIVVLGKKSEILKAIENNTLLDYISVTRDIENEVIVSCYEYENNGNGGLNDIKPNDDTDGDGNFYDSQNISRHAFDTESGDMHLSGNDDPDAVTRHVIVTNCSLTQTGYSPFSYINVVPHSDITSNWITGIEAAIQEWNNAINNNPNFTSDGNSHGDIPRILFRLASETNSEDYGNVRIFFKSDEQLGGALAEGSRGRYAVFPNGTMQHIIGSIININENSSGANFQLAKATIVHELAHSLGFYHTNQVASNITGTTQNTNSAWTALVRPWDEQGFSTQDLLAIERIFSVSSTFEWYLGCPEEGGLGDDIGL